MKLKSLIVAAAVLFGPALAEAQAVTVNFTVGPSIFSTTITAPNAARLQAWALAAYPTIPNPAFDPACIVPPASSCPPLTLPNPDPGKSALAAIWQGIINNILGNEKAVSTKAIADPAPIN